MKPTTWKQDPAAVTITSGAREQLVRVNDGTETYFASFRRNRTVRGIARAFAKGYAHGEVVNAVKITICRLVKGEWVAMGSASFDRRGVIGAAEVLRFVADLLLWSVLRRCRENRGLTQTQAAKLIGIEQPTLSGFESGRQPLQETTLLKAARGYGLTLRELLLEGLAEASPEKAKLSRKGGGRFIVRDR